MASQLKVDTITGVTTAGSIAVTGEGNSTTTNLQQGLTKNWCSLVADTGTPVVEDSLNVSSLADVGAGKHTINITNAMANDDYSLTMSTALTGSRMVASAGAKALITTTAYRVNTFATGSTEADAGNVSTAVHGDLA